ncbi:hypothetical protein [Brevundimonas sp. UBA7664]|uniref:hypothetical protein n=1 Tax=Brevundimonas sp. UBA7664 TaxID=1946141 RepID=UPI0025C2AE7E|nr:hypothetical protein [Brevundimonas sp. UBA7664]
MSPIYAVSLGLLIVSAALAFWRGGGWERATAAALVLVWIGTAFVAPFNHAEPPWVIIGLDGATMLFLLYLALYSKRQWTIWAAAFQFLLMANHLAFVRFRELDQWAYVTAYYVWGDAVLLCLISGVIWGAHKAAPAAGPAD